MVDPVHGPAPAQVGGKVLALDARGRRDVPEGQPAPAPVGTVGLGAVDQVGIVQGYAARRHDEVDRPGFVHLQVEFRTQHVLPVRRTVPVYLLIPVASGNHPHAPVLRSRVVHGQPYGDDFHGFQRPVVPVLVPQHRLTVPGRLADVVRREQRDVGTQEGLDDVDEPGVGAEAYPEGIVHDQVMVILLGPDVGVLPSHPLDMPLGLGGQFAVDDPGQDDVAVFLVSPYDAGTVHGAPSPCSCSRCLRRARPTTPIWCLKSWNV